MLWIQSKSCRVSVQESIRERRASKVCYSLREVFAHLFIGTCFRNAYQSTGPLLTMFTTRNGELPLERQLACLLLVTPSWWESAAFVHMLPQPQKALTYQPETCMPQITNTANSPNVSISVVSSCNWLTACGSSYVRSWTRVL